MMTNEEAKELIEKYNAGKCTETEKALLEDWYMQLNEHEIDLTEEEIEQLKLVSQKRLPVDRSKTILLIKALSAAAAVAFFILGNYYFILNEKQAENQKVDNSIQSGTNRATITLSNGKSIDLSNSKTGIIIDVDEIIYSDGTPLEKGAETALTKTVSTPKGGQYQLLFKDGTKIWLNAASSISFKSNLSKLSPREVNLQGEAYFEIAKNKDRPFKVYTDGQVIEVLGTHFNVSAYKEDGRTKTTLLEGSVKINDRSILKSGDQATLFQSNITVEKVDIENAIAWKNGEIMFGGESLGEIMPKLARWYDVEVSYANPALAKKRFGGAVSKFDDVAEVLNVLEQTGTIHFKIEGRRITVMP